MYQQMDPYQDINSVPTAGSVAGSIAKAAINPINWAALFPNAIDVNRGITVPFFNRYDLSFSNIKKAFGKVDPSKWKRRPLQSLSYVSKRLKSKKPKIIGYERFSHYNKLRQIYQEQLSEINKLLSRKGSDYSINKYLSIEINKVKDSLQNPSNLKKLYRNDKKALDAINYLEKSGKKLTRGHLLGTKAMRMGMRAAKFGGYVSLAVGIIELGMMVGEPLGRSIVSNANSAITSIQNRYMPEMTMGGLQHGFLTQAAATERQRAIEALSKSSLNGRSAFGQEAMYYQ